MAPLKGPVLMALVYLVCMTKTTLAMQCEEPDWNVDELGPDPVAERRGKVVLVALLKGYCGYCIEQAGRLQTLKTNLIESGYPDIDMVIINGGEERSRVLVNNLINASPLTVIQDTRDHIMYRRIFRSNKDDFLVYDRCGQAVIRIPHPYSNLERGITERVLKRVHNGEHSCYCSRDYDEDTTQADDPSASVGQGYQESDRNHRDDVMQGDDPSASVVQGYQEPNKIYLNCFNPHDKACNRLRRFLRILASDPSGFGRPIQTQSGNDVMLGDYPGAPVDQGYQETNRNVLNCPSHDKACRRLQNFIRNLLPSSSAVNRPVLTPDGNDVMLGDDPSASVVQANRESDFSGAEGRMDSLRVAATSSEALGGMNNGQRNRLRVGSMRRRDYFGSTGGVGGGFAGESGRRVRVSRRRPGPQPVGRRPMRRHPGRRRRPHRRPHGSVSRNAPQ